LDSKAHYTFILWLDWTERDAQCRARAARPFMQTGPALSRQADRTIKEEALFGKIAPGKRSAIAPEERQP